METFLSSLISWCTSFGFKLLAAIIILIIGWLVVGKLTAFLKKAKKFSSFDKTAANFVTNAVGITLKTILVVIVISIMGVPMASVVTVIATAGAAIGLALQGGLSNIAGGILIMIFKPFKLGDYITSDGESGTVTDINIFYTTLVTPDKKTIHLPNGVVAGNKVVDVSSEPIRRVDFEFNVEYSANTEGIIALLKKIGESDERVLADPAVTVLIGGYNEKGVTVYLRVWCNSADYWDIFFDMNKAVKEAFDHYDVKFAVPQLDVRLNNGEAQK